jgi:hypothetical protein
VKILIIGNDVVSDAYLLRTYVRNEDKDLSPYGREVKKLYQQLVMLLDEFRAIRKSRISSQSGSGQ